MGQMDFNLSNIPAYSWWVGLKDTHKKGKKDRIGCDMCSWAKVELCWQQCNFYVMPEMHQSATHLFDFCDRNSWWTSGHIDTIVAKIEFRLPYWTVCTVRCISSPIKLSFDGLSCHSSLILSNVWNSSILQHLLTPAVRLILNGKFGRIVGIQSVFAHQNAIAANCNGQFIKILLSAAVFFN